MNNQRKYTFLLLAIYVCAFAVVFSGCGKQTDEKMASTDTVQESTENESSEEPDGEFDEEYDEEPDPDAC